MPSRVALAAIALPLSGVGGPTPGPESPLSGAEGPGEVKGGPLVAVSWPAGLLAGGGFFLCGAPTLISGSWALLFCAVLASCVVWTPSAVCAPARLDAIDATARQVDVERKSKRKADIRPRSRPRMKTGNTPRPKRRNEPRHSRPLAVFGSCPRPHRSRTTTELDVDARDTPPERSRVTRCWWQISWLAGHCLQPPSREMDLPVASAGRRLSAYSCGGSRGVVSKTRSAPRSLLIPCGNHQ
jgi:hypothetical protein